MKGRDKLFFNLLSFLLLVVIVLVGVKTREADKQIKRWESEIQKRQERGVQDPQLRETVDKLEADLRKRLTETFELDCDPLDLTRVIKTKKFIAKLGLETQETEGRMRLAATVVGKNSSAIVKFRGRSNMLSVGDKLDNYKVTYISKNMVRLVRGGEVLELKTEKAPDTIAELERIYGPEGADKPKIEVKEISVSN